MELKGLHHVSALTANAVANFEFYTQVMGMRLVKKTVNQDDTSVYHLFYGDDQANPGTELTFFEIPNAGRNRDGVDSISGTSLRVASDQALSYWKQRLEQFDVEHEEIKQRFGRATLALRDPEGMRLILVSDERNTGVAGGIPWAGSAIPQEFGVVGLGPVQLTVREPEATAYVLTEIMGFQFKGAYPALVEGQPDIQVYETGQGGTGAEVHIEPRTDLAEERLGRGGVHHVAFRVENEAELRKWVDHIQDMRLPSSGFVDRYYFGALYFREPNGILFELSTDGPGFDVDEDMLHLGEKLALPPFLEEKREQIEAKLKPLVTT